jgi:hypothetical protein
MTRAQTPAERQRRRRTRDRDGKRVAQIEIDAALVEDALLRTGYLTRADSDDRAKVDAALCRAVEVWSKEKIAAALASRVTTRLSELS